MKELLTLEELAAALKVRKSWIYQHTRLKANTIPHIHLGKYLRLYFDDVMEWAKGLEELETLEGEQSGQ